MSKWISMNSLMASYEVKKIVRMMISVENTQK